jgi:hypothetical protein
VKNEECEKLLLTRTWGASGKPAVHEHAEAPEQFESQMWSRHHCSSLYAGPIETTKAASRQTRSPRRFLHAGIAGIAEPPFVRGIVPRVCRAQRDTRGQPCENLRVEVSS